MRALLIFLSASLPGACAETFFVGNWSVAVLKSSTSWRLDATSPSSALALTLYDSSITAASVNFSIYEGDGNYQFSIVDTVKWDSPSLDSISQPEPFGPLFLSGSFTGGVQWSFCLSDAADASQHLAFNYSVDGGGGPPDNGTAVAVSLNFAGAQGEHYFGLGTQYSFYELLQRSVAVWTSEQGVGRGLQPITAIVDALDRGSGGSANTTYTQMPVLVSSTGRGLSLDNLGYSEWSFADVGDGFAVRSLSSFVSGRVWAVYGGSLLDAAASFAHVSGSQPPLPTWVNDGAIVGLEGGTDAVLASLKRIYTVVPDASVASVWIQDWTGGVNYTTGLPRYGVYWSWTGVNISTYPEWTESLLPALSSRGSRVLVYANPHLVRSGALYDEALSRGALVLVADGTVFTTYGDHALVDVTNETTATWFASALVSALVSASATGLMADFGEAFPVSAIDGLAKHGAFPSAWASVAAAVSKGVGGEGQDGLHFMRSASTASPRHVPLFWLGDQLTSWDEYDGLASIPRALLSSALCGMGVTHIDIGLYTSLALGAVPVIARTKELFLRSAELAAFTWAFRTHPGSDPSINWQLTDDDETITLFFAMQRLFTSLAPYRGEVAAELAEKGTPVFIPTTALYPSAPWDLDAQFFLGRKLLVAPVLKPLAQNVSVWLPRGLWRHAITNVTLVGNDATIIVPAPIGTPAAFWAD